jgi:hypothetical protein
MSMGVGFMPMEMDVTLDDLRFIENTINIIFSVEWVPTPHALVLPELLRPSQPLSSPIHACGVCVCVCVRGGDAACTSPLANSALPPAGARVGGHASVMLGCQTQPGTSPAVASAAAPLTSSPWTADDTPERWLTAWVLDRDRYGVRFFASGFSKKWFLQPQSLVDLAAVTPGILQAFGVGGDLLQGARILRILRLLRLVR